MMMKMLYSYLSERCRYSKCYTLVNRHNIQQQVSNIIDYLESRIHVLWTEAVDLDTVDLTVADFSAWVVFRLVLVAAISRLALDQTIIWTSEARGYGRPSPPSPQGISKFYANKRRRRHRQLLCGKPGSTRRCFSLASKR